MASASQFIPQQYCWKRLPNKEKSKEKIIEKNVFLRSSSFTETLNEKKQLLMYIFDDAVSTSKDFGWRED